MDLFKYRQEFEFETSLKTVEIFSALCEFVEFNHKKQISTYQIKKEFYGNVISENQFQIWKKPPISGFMDKGLAPCIEIVFEKGKILVKIEEYIFPFCLFFCAIIIVSSLISIIAGLQYKDFGFLIFFGFLILLFPAIGFFISRRVFFSTIARVKELITKRLIQ